MNRPRVFFDADVLLAGSASTTGASHILLRLSELTVIEGLSSQQATTEARRNLQLKLPDAVSAFDALVSAAVQVVPDPDPGDISPYADEADRKDAPILAAACLQNCDYLVTFNTSDYWPPERSILVLEPGSLLARIRDRLAALASGQD